MYTLIVKQHFDAAHRIPGHGGKCANIHGHTYKVEAEFRDSELNELAEGPMLAIHQSDEIMGGMDEWNTNQHGKSGLTKRVKNSTLTVADAERETLEFLRQYVPKGVSPMCGNSICQDRRFMARLMPELEDFFLYRNLDVSTLKELAKRWAPDVAKGVVKQSSHLALDDTRDSINELRHYREHLFKSV